MRGTAQKQARPLRFKGAVKDVRVDTPRGVSLAAMLDGCGASAIGLRDAALLSVAYDTGLRAAELVALAVEDLVAAIDADAGLIMVRRTKSDQEGEGATAYLSPRSMRALRLWLKRPDRGGAAVPTGVRPAHAGSGRGRRCPVGAGRRRRTADGQASRRSGGRGAYPLHCRRRGADGGVGHRCVPAGDVARAFAAGSLPDLDAREFAAWVAGVSAHSTRVGLTQDLFSAGEDLAGIMDALRWKTPRMPLLYNRNLAAESGAAGRVVSRL